MTMMVALVGGQALPNLLPARFYRPSSMLLVYTQTTKEKYERLKTALEQETIIYGLETDAYNIVKITEVLNQKLDNPEFTIYNSSVTVSPSQSHEVITNASQIQVISLQGYTLGTDRLTTSDAAELIAMVDKAMKR